MKYSRVRESKLLSNFISSYQGFVIIFIEDVEDLFIFILLVAAGRSDGWSGPNAHRRTLRTSDED